MSITEIKNAALSGTAAMPPSKSVSHRALISSFLAGAGSVAPLIESDDTRATTGVLTAIREGKSKLDCIESGSTLRFMIPVAAALGIDAEFVGRGSLLSRTIGAYLELLPQHGVCVESNGCLPMSISGRLTPGEYRIAGDVSSQYITGLLLALPLLDGDSTVVLTTKLQSKPYVDITVGVLADFGIKIEETPYGYFVRGNQKYVPCDYTVEADWSQSAFFLAAGILGGDVTLTGLNFDSLQGDKKIADVLRSFGGDIEYCAAGVRARSSSLHGVEIDVSDIPDLVPVLAVVGAFADGDTLIKGGERLRYKESDRIASVCKNLELMGVSVEQHSDGMLIHGTKPHGARLDGCNDHRIVMAFSVAALYADGDTLITDADSIRKSYPGFFDDYNSLGGKANVICDR